MVDQTMPASDDVAPVCPWCSAPLADPTVDTCPSCGATLVGGSDEALPGLTAVDPVAIVRSKQAPRQRSRLLSWLSGDDGSEDFTPAQGKALAPPDIEVRREMLRLQLEAEVANLQAENDAILAEAAAEGRIVEVPTEPTAADEPGAEGDGAAGSGDGPAAPDADTGDTETQQTS